MLLMVVVVVGKSIIDNVYEVDFIFKYVDLKWNIFDFKFVCVDLFV